MAALTKADLLAAKPKIEAVAVPELGDDATVYLREISAAGAVGYGGLHSSLQGTNEVKAAQLMAHLLRYAICDQEGKRLFADDESPLEVLPFAIANRLFAKALELSRIGATDTPKKSSEKAKTSTLHAA